MITKLKVLALGLLAVLTTANARAQNVDALVNKLVERGVLSEKEGKDLLAESSQTNAAAASKWKLSDTFKNISLYGDVRFRYEYRSADNAPGSGATGNDYTRERFRYAVRIGLRGDLFDDFYYGLRVETSSNPRSPWVTFGDDTTSSSSASTPSAKNSDGINIGQVYLGWRPTSWFDITVGKMPMPIYTTPMIWDSDINPEGAAERFKLSLDKADLFATFGQFLYQFTDPAPNIPSDDTFILAWQLGANLKLTPDMSLKFAPVLYNYTGVGNTNKNNPAFGPGNAYNGQGLFGLNGNGVVGGVTLNQGAINNLLVLEIPAELNFKISRYNARLFGDFAYNISGDDRARAAARSFPPTSVVNPNTGQASVVGLSHPYTGQDKAYQIGFGLGNLGLVYGQTSKKNTWEARVYWQHIEQYAVDVNLIDSDFFERANLEGIYSAFAYSFTDSIIGTARYGYAHQINKDLGTGGQNPDLPVLNSINNYHLLQLDLTWRF